jgi:hypothetical protein
MITEDTHSSVDLSVIKSLRPNLLALKTWREKVGAILDLGVKGYDQPMFLWSICVVAKVGMIHRKI